MNPVKPTINRAPDSSILPAFVFHTSLVDTTVHWPIHRVRWDIAYEDVVPFTMDWDLGLATAASILDTDWGEGDDGF